MLETGAMSLFWISTFSRCPRMQNEMGHCYSRPLSTVPKDPATPWFSIQPVGRNKLNAMMKTKSIQAGLPIIHTIDGIGLWNFSKKKFQSSSANRALLYRGVDKVSAHLRRAVDGHIYILKGTSELEEPSASVQLFASVQPFSFVAVYGPAANQPLLPILHLLPTWWQLQPLPRPFYPHRQTSCYNGCTFNPLQANLNFTRKRSLN